MCPPPIRALRHIFFPAVVAGRYIKLHTSVPLPVSFEPTSKILLVIKKSDQYTPLAPYIGTMQVGPDPGNPGPSHPGEFDIREDTPMHDPSSASAGNPSSAGRAPEPTVLTRLQQKKRAAITQPEDPASAEEPEVPPAAPKGKSIPQKKRS